MSTAGRKQTTIGPGHDGKPKRGFFAAKGDVRLVPDHGPNGSTNQKRPKTGNLARDGKPKSHLSVSIHNGMKPQPAGGRGHPQGAAPVNDGGVPTDRTHPFERAPSPQLSHGKLAPVKDGMRSRINDAPHGGATSASGGHTGDPVRELGFADPTHPKFRGKGC